MTKFFAAAALAATVLAGSVVPSLAVTTTIPGVDGQQYNSPKETTSFSDSYTFTLLMGNYVSASFSGQKTLKDIAFGIYQGASEILKGTVVSLGSSLVGSTDTGFLSAGDYSIKVTGSGSGTYNGTLSVSSVPLPTSVALFGTAILGLGVVGAMRRKGGKAEVSASA